MRILKNVTIFLFIGLVTLFTAAGCGSELTAGGLGLAGGIAASKTMQGVEADLADREQALIDRYNTAVEAGAKSEVLDTIENDINKTVLLQQGVAAAKGIAGAVSDAASGKSGTAEQYGPLAALIASLAVNFFQKRKGDLMKKTTKAIVKGIEAAEVEEKSNPTSPVKAAIEYQMKAAGIYDAADDLVNKLKISR
jgi:hypothetical protein